jgi:hypothetical protein
MKVYSVIPEFYRIMQANRWPIHPERMTLPADPLLKGKSAFASVVTRIHPRNG